MQDDSEFKFRMEVTLPASDSFLLFPMHDAYSVGFVLNYISVVKYPCDPSHHSEPNSLSVCPECARLRCDEVSYLQGQIYEAVTNREISLWDSKLERILSPTWHYVWLIAYIYKDQLKKFCIIQRILIKFEGESAALSEDPSPISELGIATQERTADVMAATGAIANYKQLAEAFRVKQDEDQNLTWFKNRCSDLKKYPDFAEALVKRGKPGRGGNAATFNVLRIIAHLYEKASNKNKRTPRFRSGVEKCFPDLLHEFDTYFGLNDTD